MYGLVKLANLNRQIQESGQAFLDKVKSQPYLSDADYQATIDKLRNQYGLKADVADAGFSEAARFVTPKHQHAFDKMTDTKIGEHGTVHTTPIKEVLLHESGHALDPNFDRNMSVAKGLLHGSNAAAVGAGIGAGVSGAKNEEKGIDGKSLAIAGAGIAGGAGLGYGAGKMGERLEDDANKFAKRYMTDELGDATKAQAWFDNSALPQGRKTYELQTKNWARRGALGGAMTGLAGLGVGSLMNKKKEEQ